MPNPDHGTHPNRETVGRVVTTREGLPASGGPKKMPVPNTPLIELNKIPSSIIKWRSMGLRDPRAGERVGPNRRPPPRQASFKNAGEVRTRPTQRGFGDTSGVWFGLVGKASDSVTPQPSFKQLPGSGPRRRPAHRPLGRAAVCPLGRRQNP